MYSKDSRIIYTLLFFFSVGTADEFLRLIGYNHDITSILYIGLMIYTFLNYNRYTDEGYLWEGAFPIIGLFSLMEMFANIFNFYSSFFERMDSIVSIVVWIKCVQYLNDYKKNKEDKDGSVEEI